MNYLQFFRFLRRRNYLTFAAVAASMALLAVVFMGVGKHERTNDGKVDVDVGGGGPQTRPVATDGRVFAPGSRQRAVCDPVGVLDRRTDTEGTRREVLIHERINDANSKRHPEVGGRSEVPNPPGSQGVTDRIERQQLRAGSSFAARRQTFIVTAYCSCKKCCGPRACGITASGKPVTANGGAFLAADRRLPFGTVIRVPGYASGLPVPVLDRGGAITAGRLDVYYPTHQAALNWGRKTLTVEIIND